jgi:uncharacterized membrane protein YgaE (UPF0421/DUF939 family)
MQAEIPAVWHLVNKAIIGLVIAGIGSLLMYPLKKIKEEWKGLKAAIASTEAELVQQRINCLSTLQTQGDRQVQLLEKVSETLSEIHLDQKETLGFLRAKS